MYSRAPSLLSLLLGATAFSGGCNCDKLPTVETPESMFVTEGVQIEHRKDGKIAWSGTAERALGDPWSTHAHGIRLRRNPTSPDQPEIEIESNFAKLLFHDGRAEFEKVKVHDGRGGTLAAGNAEYVEETQQIHANGPVRYEAPGMVATGKEATLFIDEGRVEVTGPIEGTFDPSQTSP